MATENKTTSETKEWTSTLPMVGLEEAIKIVTDIRDNALETAAMSDVAKKLGFASATSTPFYRRMVAARLFGLLESKALLSQRATDYIKPDADGMKEAALTDAILGIQSYADLVKKHTGKKINVDLLANGIAKDFNLADSCALVCAKAFVASLTFAGMLLDDGSVQAKRASVQPPRNEDKTPPPAVEPEKQELPSEEEHNDTPDTQTHTLLLDKSKTRKFKFVGPVEVTTAEYDRICKWLGVTLLVQENNSLKNE